MTTCMIYVWVQYKGMLNSELGLALPFKDLMTTQVLCSSVSDCAHQVNICEHGEITEKCV